MENRTGRQTDGQTERMSVFSFKGRVPEKEFTDNKYIIAII